MTGFNSLQICFTPSQNIPLLAKMLPTRLDADSQSGFFLHTITGFHRPDLTHYYGLICHLAPTRASAFTLRLCFRHLPGCGVRLPQLLHWLPVSYATLKHVVGLTEYRASRYFGRLPTNTAESGSLALCTAHFLWLPSDPSVSP